LAQFSATMSSFTVIELFSPAVTVEAL